MDPPVQKPGGVRGGAVAFVAGAGGDAPRIAPHADDTPRSEPELDVRKPSVPAEQEARLRFDRPAEMTSNSSCDQTPAPVSHPRALDSASRSIDAPRVVWARSKLLRSRNGIITLTA
jgi:hypothetical protein